jgi:two-component system, NarL family, sensor histidine kinase UhpB
MGSSTHLWPCRHVVGRVKWGWARMDSARARVDAVAMSGRAGPRPGDGAGGAGTPGEQWAGWASALFWRVFALNGLVFVAAAAALVVSPATVSRPVTVKEVAVLAGGLVVMLGVNALLLRASLRPLDGLTALMRRVDLLRPGQRATVAGNGDIAQLIRTFNEMLDRLEAERGASAARTLAALEGERQRIAQELHDEVGQGLTAALLGLKRAIDRGPSELAAELGAVQDITRASLDEVRQVARRLRPGVLDDLGLRSALNALVRDFAEMTGVRVTPRIPRPMPRLEPAAELVIYRIAQESLTNIARHANATHVDLSLVDDRTQVVLRVVDDGRGIDGVAEGAGIRGMRERALLVGADLAIGSGPAGGTQVQLTVGQRASRPEET